MRMTGTPTMKLGRKAIPTDALDELLKRWGGPRALLGSDDLLKATTAALVERALEAEAGHRLGYERNESPPGDETNRRTGKTAKTVRTTTGPVGINVPRERAGSFEPVLMPKHERHFDGFDDQILSMYARGMSDRDIRPVVKETYGTDVSPDLIGHVADAVVDDMNARQSSPLEPTYPSVYLDALVTKIRDEGVVENKSVYLAVGVAPDGAKDVPGT